MPKIILFNGPPRSGKDTAAQIAKRTLAERGYMYKFASPLKDAVHSIFGMAGIMLEHFDSKKSEQLPEFFGMTPREAYIWMSEEVVKPKFGKDFFTKVAIQHLKNFNDNTIIISDCGFQEEVDGLVEYFGAKNVYVIYMEREGTDYTNDSRSKIKHIDENCIKIKNNYSFEVLQRNIKLILKEIDHD